jgi:hypothetical protein
MTKTDEHLLVIARQLADALIKYPREGHREQDRRHIGLLQTELCVLRRKELDRQMREYFNAKKTGAQSGE